jgi:acyl-coenzyme A thioesterase PaaI-like protein
MMMLADTAMYAAILTTMGAVILAVTTNLNINFLRKPEPDKDLVGESWLMKVGKRLIVGEVIIYSQDDPEPVAHATCTYSIPPDSQPTEERC